MESLTDGFGQLSTTAKEWKPASSRQGNDASSSYSSPVSPQVPTSPSTQHTLSSALHQVSPGRSGWQLEPRTQWSGPSEFVPSWKGEQRTQHQAESPMQQPSWVPQRKSLSKTHEIESVLLNTCFSSRCCIRCGFGAY